jgi:hypothetical protein
VCELHTEASTRILKLSKGSHGIPVDGSDVVVDPGKSDLSDFDAIPSLHRYINGNPLDSFIRMMNADVLVISKSSFSYLAGLLSTSSVVVYNNFEHPPMPGWLHADGLGNLNSRDLNCMIERILGRMRFRRDDVTPDIY